MRWISKKDPYRDLAQETRVTTLTALRRPPLSASRRTSRSRLNDSVATLDLRRPSMDVRAASRTDMSTGLVSIDRGFDFATEENGVAMRRMQSNMSERRASSRNLPRPTPSKKGKETLSQVFSLRRVRRKMSSIRKSE